MSSENIIAATPVGDVLPKYPKSASVFTRFGIDTCCGSGRPIAEGARVAGADVNRLVAELQEIAEV